LLQELNLPRSPGAADGIGEFVCELPLVSLSYEESLLGNSGITEAFGKMKKLRRLAMHHVADSSALLRIKKLRKLLHLDLSGCYALTWPDLAAILSKTKKLRSLCLNWNRRLHDISAVTLLPNLRELEFVHGQVETVLLRATLARLAKKLVRLSLAYNLKVDDGTIKVLSSFTKLKQLTLSGCTDVSMEAIAEMSKVKSLRFLNLSKTGKRGVLRPVRTDPKRNLVRAAMPKVNVEFASPDPQDIPIVRSLILERINHIGW
jgi:hypothetical protein